MKLILKMAVLLWVATLVLAACGNRSDSTGQRPPEVGDGPALLMFYTDG